MDQTNIHFEPKTGKTWAETGSRTVSSKDSGSNQKKCTVCITVASDGTILPPFFIFKGVPGAKIKSKMAEYGICGCSQLKGWFDERVGPKYIDQVVAPCDDYVRSFPVSPPTIIC
jgi:hypothetical protein